MIGRGREGLQGGLLTCRAYRSISCSRIIDRFFHISISCMSLRYSN